MLSRLFRLLIDKQPPKKCGRSQRITARRALFEGLEQRQLLAVTSIQAFDDVAPVVAAFQATTITNDNRLSIAINTPHPEGLADISIYKNGTEQAVQQFENIPTDAAGVARITSPVLADGDYLVRARAGLYARYFFICEPGLAEFEAEGTLTFRVDTGRPLPIVSSPVRGPTNSADPLPFVVNFSEPVQGFQATDAIITNGTIERMIVNSPSSFTIFVRPAAAGDVSLRIPAGVAADAAFNPNTASNRLDITFDPLAPALLSVTRQPAGSGITNADSLVFRATFSEAVANVDGADFLAVGTTAAVTGVVQVSPRVFDLTLSGGDLAGLNGPVALQLQAGQDITDLAGTLLATDEPSINQRYFLDNTRPTVRISTGVASPTNDASIPLRAVFSEAVVGLTESDIVVANGTVQGLSGTGKVYTFTVEPAADGIVTVRVPSASAQDAAGNDNFASNQISIRSDSTAPTVIVASSSANPTNAASIPFTVTFEQAVTGFTASDPIITNGTISGFTGSGATYRFQVIPSADGPVSVRVPAAVAQDAAGNDNVASGVVSIVSDRTPPSAVLSTSLNSPTNDASIPVRLQFSEAVSGLTLSDIVVSNGTASNLTGSGQLYTFRVTPLADGVVTIRVPQGSARDAARNGNVAAVPLSIRSDQTAPRTTISSSSVNPTNAATIPFRITFSESVVGFIASDIGIVNGTLTSFAGSGSIYNIQVAPNGDGLVTIKVPGGVAKDAAGNGNIFAAPLSIRSDRTRPTTSISSSSADPTRAAQIPFRITFSEPVTGFTASDIGLVNGTLASFTGSGAFYDIQVAPAGDGLVTVKVAGAVAEDAAGNANVFATPLSIRSDRTRPTTSVSSNSADPTGAAQIPFHITFSEVVLGFSAGDVQIQNGTLTSFAGSGSSYDIQVSPNADGQVTVTVPGLVARDAAGNANLASAPVRIRSDRTAPTADVSSTLAGPTNADVIPFTIVFNEPVTSLAEASLVVVNGDIIDFTPAADGLSYTVNIAPKVDGQVQLTVPGGTVRDAAGNGNTAGSFAVVSDRTAPRVTLTYNPPPANPPPLFLGTVTITFTEPVTGLDINDLQLTFAGEVLIPLTELMLSGSGATYTLDLSKLPLQSGRYELTLTAAGSDIFDLAGNALLVDGTTTWTHFVGNP